MEQSKSFFTQSNQYKPLGVETNTKQAPPDRKGIEQELWKYVNQNSTQNNPQSVYKAIDKFCKDNWMMNLGPEKGVILKDQLEASKPKTILQLGTYCGYSSVFFSTLISPDAKIYTLEINEKTIEVAHKIFQWAGIQNQVVQLKGPIQENIQEVKKIGKVDFVFLDHWKNVYLSDLKFLQSNNIIQKGTVVAADNVICPGVPDYLEYMKANPKYKSTLYHSQLQYSPHIPDAVLVSTMQ